MNSLLGYFYNPDRKVRLLFDMDDVITDLCNSIIKKANKKFGMNYKLDDISCWDLEKLYGKGVLDIFFQEGFFLDLNPKEGSLEVFESIYKDSRYDTKIVTSVMPTPTCYCEKIEWIKKYMPYFNLKKDFITCSDKGSVWGDVLIDDRVENLEAFSKIGIGEAIVMDMPHNKNFENGIRVHNLKEAKDYIEKRYNIVMQIAK